MSAQTGNFGGLLIVGVVVAVAAVTMKAGLQDASNQQETQTAAVAQDALPPVNTGAADQESEEQIMSHSTTPQQAQGTVGHASDADFQDKVLNADGRVLVDFYADWCGPCRMIAPVLEEVAREEAGAKIVKVNVDTSPNVAGHFGIQSIPALLAFENGRVVDQHIGVASKTQLRSLLGL
jgi:thioredoxin 1